ncbi:MAG: ATP-binding protein [Syntrophales bacterium]|nr:ATP-binding protein [Syntrophales bacterium]
MKPNKDHPLEKIDRYQDELNKKGRILSSIYKISQLLNRPANRDKILQAILHESQKIFGLSRGVILLLNKAEDRLEAKYNIGFTPSESAHAFAHPLWMKTQICRETIAAKTGKTIYARDVRNDPNLTDCDRKMEWIWKRVSAITVPLKINREVIGVIEGDRIDQEMVLSSSDIKLFTAFANQASIILENARLYEQVLTERNIAENILESAPNGILAIDRHKKIRSINRTVEKILRLKRRKIMGKPVSEILRKDVVEMLDDILNNQRVTQYAEIARNKKDKTTEIYGVNFSILKGHAGQVAGAIMAIQDLTEIKQTEMMLRRVDNLSSLGQMSANIAHEIRNPLASINFNIQRLSKKLANDQSVRRVLNNTQEGIDRIKTVIRQTLDFAKNINPSMTYGNIHNIIADSITLIAQQLKMRKIEIRKDLCTGVPEIFFDPHQIRTVLVNLLLNATEAMPRGGTITIRTKVEENAVTQGSGRLLMTVKDNGIGIPHENLKRIFDPFFTTKPEGTGLGLSIAHKILEQHNALIDVKSRENRGTCFFLRFPLSEAANNHVPIQDSHHG